MGSIIYKAGDFTNGKMNDIFKEAFGCGSASINHKQFGSFYLVNGYSNEMLARRIYAKIAGVDVDEVTAMSEIDLVASTEMLLRVNGEIDSHRNVNNLIDGLLLLVGSDLI